MENEIQDIIRQMRELTARLEALLPQEQKCAPESVHTINFTVGDRYRFLRELFGNSTAEMQRVMTDLEAAQNEPETLGYISALGWDLESQVAKDFTAAVTERFKSSPTLLA